MPGTTTATLFIKPTAFALLSVDGKFPAVLFLIARAASGLFASGGITPSANTANLKTLFPDQSVPIDTAGTLMNPTWYRFFRYLVYTVLGGPQASTLPDVATALTYSETQALIGAALTAGLAQQAIANAQALAAVVQVAQMAALPGAPQIPPVVLAPPETGGGD